MGVATSAAQCCGVHGRDDEILAHGHRRGAATMQDWLDEGSRNGLSKGGANGSSKSPFPAPLEKPCSLEHAMEQSPALPGCAEPAQIVAAILAIESVCRGNIDAYLNTEHREDEARVEVMINEPGVRYCICHDPKTPLVTACFWIELAEITVDEAVLALGNKKERQRWDADAQFDILQEKQDDDPLSAEVTFHLLRAPWPFWDRDVLQRRNCLPLTAKESALGEGVAFVTQSIDDPSIYPRNDARIRATVYMAGHLLRPLSAENAQNRKEGISVTVCQKLDIGGIAPPWAQSLLCRFAARQGQNWAERLRQHCLAMRSRRAGASRDSAAVRFSSELPDLPPSGFDLWERELMGQ